MIQDWDAGTPLAIEYENMLDVLKKGEEIKRELNDDELVSFGADPNLVDYEIKLKELDPK